MIASATADPRREVVWRRELEWYRTRTQASASLHERARRVMPGGETRTLTFWRPHPLFVERGQGPWLYDVDGNRYVDLVNNYTSLVHGHAHPAIVAAVAEQLTRGTGFAAALEAQLPLAELLVERVPSLDLVRFCNSGTEATLFALRAARAFTGRPRIVKIEGGYHGTHDAVEVSVSPPPDDDLSGPREAPLALPDTAGLVPSIASGTLVIPFNDLPAAERCFARHGDEIAALIVEPMLGVAGDVPAEPGYLLGLREITLRHGALLVFDEVQTLRLAPGGLQERYGVTPDLTALAKIVAGGLPGGAFGGRADVMALFDASRPGGPALPHSGTFNGNAASMVAGFASMTLLTAAAIERLNALGDRLAGGLRAALADTGVPGEVTGVGSMLNIHLAPSRTPVRDYRSAASASRPLAELFHLACLNRGVFVAPRGMLNLSTPMGEVEVDDALERMRGALASVAASLG